LEVSHGASGCTANRHKSGALDKSIGTGHSHTVLSQ
jgi:hypothetical protein